jgi:hypothetical protein
MSRLTRDMGRSRYAKGYVELTVANNWKAHWYQYVKDEHGIERRVHRSAIVGTKAKMRKFEAEEELAKRSGAAGSKETRYRISLILAGSQSMKASGGTPPTLPTRNC